MASLTLDLPRRAYIRPKRYQRHIPVHVSVPAKIPTRRFSLPCARQTTRSRPNLIMLRRLLAAIKNESNVNAVNYIENEGNQMAAVENAPSESNFEENDDHDEPERDEDAVKHMEVNLNVSTGQGVSFENGGNKTAA